MAVEEATVPKPGASRAELYTWQSWVHVGPDAENCEDVNEAEGTVECNNPLHFHAWVRLPNPHQWRDIRDKAMAAKARRMRLMREDGSDLNVILEEDIEALARKGDSAREEVIEELVAVDWWKYILGAQRSMQFERVDPDDDESELRWEHIDDDRVELAKLRALHEDEQPKDEIEVIERRVKEYDEAMEERRKEGEQPLRDELAQLDISALLDRLRDSRVAGEGSARFDEIFAEWQMVTCTYRQVEGTRHWIDIDELASVPEGVTRAARSAFLDLTREKGGLLQGNS